MDKSIPKVLLVILVIVIGASVVAIIDDTLGIDFRNFSFFAHAVHNITCMLWGVALWKAFEK